MKLLYSTFNGLPCLPDKRMFLGASADGIERRLIREYSFFPGLMLREENWRMTGDETDMRGTVIRAVYTKAGHYVGDERFARYLVSRGISPELASPTTSVCSVGFIKRSNKWAGWSHRCLAEFGIGDRIFDPEYGNDSTPFVQHGATVIETLEQARQAAVNFADYVS